MIAPSLEKALAYAERHNIPRVIEVRCPRSDCGKTVYAATDSDQHEHTAWLHEINSKRFSRHIYCKHCHYGALGGNQGHFLFVTHHVQQR